jgi:hypothetical protein
MRDSIRPRSKTKSSWRSDIRLDESHYRSALRRNCNCAVEQNLPGYRCAVNTSSSGGRTYSLAVSEWFLFTIE